MAGFPYGAQVVNGTNAVGSDHNNGRKDGLTRWLKFEIIGTLATGNKQGGSFLMPFAGTVVQIYNITTSGTATGRLNMAAVVSKTGISITSAWAVDSTITNPNFSKGDLATFDLTAASGTDCVIMVEVLPTP